jgi:hypothetical protein
MPPIPFADNFLAGSIISLVMPVGLLIVIAVWYVIAARRLPEGSSGSSRPTAPATEPRPDPLSAKPESPGTER